MKVEIDPVKFPNILGEALRCIFFKNTFNLFDDIKITKEGVPEFDMDKDPPELTTKNVEFTFTCGVRNGVKVNFYFDGDMFLSFELPCGKYLVNDDAKKDYNWKCYNSFFEYWNTFSM